MTKKGPSGRVRLAANSTVKVRLPYPVRLYANDLVDVVGIMEEHGYRVSIRADEYTARSVDDLRSLSNVRASEVEIKSVQPGVLLRLCRDEVTLLASSADATARACLLELSAFMKSRERPLASFIDRSFTLWLCLLAPGGFFPLLSGIFNTEGSAAVPAPVTLLAAVTCVLSTIGLFGAACYYWVNKRSKAIVFVCKPEESTFWQRQKDTLFVGCFLLLASGVIGFLAARV